MRLKNLAKAKTRGAVLTAVFFIAGPLLFAPTQAISRGAYFSSASVVPLKDVVPIVIKPSGSTSSATSTTAATDSAAASVLADVNFDVSSSNMGIYTGPGDINGHKVFETWLGKPVPYTTDYIDYKGGWSYDFIDSTAWLMKPWGKWVSQGGRRLVLGVPMLENSNVGQFDRGVNGDFDVYFRSLASELIANSLGNSIIRLGYEANCNTIGPWQADDNPSGYRQLFRHEAAVMRSVPGAAFSFDWTVCNGLQSGHALNSYDSFYPGDDVVNIIGIDIYDVYWGTPGVSPQQRWNYIVSRQMGVNALVAYARAHGKALSYPEWGLYKPGDSFAGGGDNPYFIQKMAELITTTKPLYQAYFDLDWGGGFLSDFPQGAAAFKQIFGP